MRRKQLLFLPLVLLSISAYSHAQNWNGLIAPARAVDWSQVGIPGGIPSRSTICATLNPGASASQINSAIASCPSGQVVYLSAGTYNLSSGIDFANRSNVTLRGAGADQTFLVFSGHTGCSGAQADICVENGDTNWAGGPSNSASWTSGYSKGTTQITLSSTSGITPGTTVIALDQLNDSSDSGGVFVCETQGTCSQEGPAGAERSNRAQSQLVLATAVSGSTVTISPGLYMPNWSSSKSPGAWWANTVVTMDGVEDLSMDHTNSGSSSGLTFFNAYKCWVKGVRSVQADRNHVWIYGSARVVVRDSYFYGTQNAASESYGIEPYASSDSLIENNIFQHVATPVQVNGSASGTVFSYNFTINNYYGVSPGWMIAGNSLHAAGVDNLLFEGNEANALIGDNIHGTHNFITAFRNQYVGWESGKTAQTNALQIYAGIRFFNVIGNVLGKQGYHTQYQDVAPSGSNSDASIYTLGWSGNEGTSGSAGPNDPLVASTMVRWGNYDVVNNAAVWNSSEVPSSASQFPSSVPSDHTLPSSFYLASKPSWWGSMPWPAVGPDVSGGPNSAGHAYPNPAQVCYTGNGGPSDGTGSVLSFNASSCYGSGSSSSQQTAPAPPTNLTATPQ
jgi:hypothetical protein